MFMRIYILEILCTWSLFFSLSFFQKDLPLPRKSSRWVLLSFSPPFLHLFPALWGETLSLHEEKQSHRETQPSMICMPCFERSEDTWMVLVVWSVVVMWMRRRSAAGMLGVCQSLIKAGWELWMLSMVLKATVPLQSLSYWLFISPLVFPLFGC